MRCLSFSFAPEAQRLKRIVFRCRSGVQPGFACRPTRDQTLWPDALRVREGNSDSEGLGKDAILFCVSTVVRHRMSDQAKPVTFEQESTLRFSGDSRFSSG